MEPIGLQRDELRSQKEAKNGHDDVLHHLIDNLKIKHSFAEYCISNAIE